MKKIAGVLAFIICLPLIGTIFVKPERDRWKETENDISVINESFRVAVHEKIGTFTYLPEELTGLLMYRVVPKDIVFGGSEDLIAGEGTAYDPEQEYLKALAIVCRSNIVSAWEDCGTPGVLDFDKMGLELPYFYKIYHTAMPGTDAGIRFNEIKRAVTATYGAVITKENQVIAAPFFTSTRADLFVDEAGDGTGFSLNYAYELAKQGMNFREIIQYFFPDRKVIIYE